VTVLKELWKYKGDLVGVQDVRWEGGGTRMNRRIHIFLWKGKTHELGAGFFVHKRGSYQQLRGLSLLVIGCLIQY
jgi:hypothetical protein